MEGVKGGQGATLKWIRTTSITTDFAITCVVNISEGSQPCDSVNSNFQ